jgi:hypothetical protein
VNDFVLFFKASLFCNCIFSPASFLPQLIKTTGNQDGFRRYQEATGPQGSYFIPEEDLQELNNLEYELIVGITVCRRRMLSGSENSPFSN